MLDATFTPPDLTTFARLDEVGLIVSGQRLEPERAVLSCRVARPDPWCQECGCAGLVRDTVTRELAHEPVDLTVLVIDATTGQNGLQQAREFNRALDLDALIVTKLDGTAKGGVIAAIAQDKAIPLRFIGVGESIDDLRPFVARDYVNALFD